MVAKQTKGNAAAIGGGNNDKSVYNIKIENSNVTAIATDGSGIGLGYSGGTLGNIEIINSVVTATNSDSYNAGIGGGQSTNIGNILIQNSTVTATGGKYAAGIGGGWKNTVAENDKVTIIGSNVLATAGSNAQAIGKGSDGAAVSIQDGSGNALTLTKITLQNVTNDVTVTKISTTTGYEDVDIQTINGVLYLYLPSGESPTSVIANGNEYVGTVSSNVGTFVYEHTCAIGESGTPATCTTLAICGSCGQTFGELAPHTTSYLLNGNVLMESCSECTHSATATLSADEVYTYTGEEIKEATIEYSEKWQGEKPTEITYNDNVESGIATAKITVEGHELTTTFRIAKPYDITINTPENGSVTVEETTVLEGGNVVLTISPDIGYVLDVLTVTCGETDVVVTDNSFVMPSGNVSISATFKQCTSHSFENGVCTACKYECEHTQWKDGICSACGIFEQPTLTDGVYEINNVGNLFWFAEQVNSGSTAINGKLMKDIDLSGYNWVPITDPYYDKKYDDMDERLDRFYQEIAAVEEEIETLNIRLDNIKSERISTEKAYQCLINFDKFYAQFTDAEKKEVLNSFVAEIHIFPERQNQRIIKSIKFKFPVKYADGVESDMIFLDKENSPETLVCLKKQG